jgi:hypothetical protein
MPPRPVPEAGPALRGWQRRALVEYLRRRAEDFLAVATPGAGKTTFALRIAAELLADGSIDAVTVVTPTEHPRRPSISSGSGRRPPPVSASSSTRASATPTSIRRPTSMARSSHTRRWASRRRCIAGAR